MFATSFERIRFQNFNLVDKFCTSLPPQFANITEYLQFTKNVAKIKIGQIID